MKIKFTIALASLLLICSCKKEEPQPTNTEVKTDTIVPPSKSPESAPVTTGFDSNAIPISSALTGSFPYFKLPEGYIYTDPNSYHGPGETKDVDMEYFYNHGIYFPIEGKTYKAEIRADSDKFSGKKFSKLEIEKSFDAFIVGLGGVKINDGEPIKSGEKDRLSKEDPNAFAEGYMHSCHNYDNVHTYVIRTKERTVFVQYNLGLEQSSITILEPEAFENKMTMIPAAEIQKQLDTNGKAVLYINFDVDKATLQPDGIQYVAEITKLLQNDKALKISIEGHTYNTGNAAKNKTLSEQRATTVLKALVSGGIPVSRLSAKGFGSEKPLAANDSEVNKAKNRRVELIKL